jgi:hypothetical protein
MIRRAAKVVLTVQGCGHDAILFAMDQVELQACRRASDCLGESPCKGDDPRRGRPFDLR